MPGHTLADCDPVDLNRTEAYVSWNRVSWIEGAPDPLVLHFEFRDAKLYGFEFEH
jgi:hypothetical protein